MNDRIKHLRSVHFLLLAISFAIFSTINFDVDDSSQKALSDLQIINSSLKNWKSNFLFEASKRAYLANATPKTIKNDDKVKAKIGEAILQQNHIIRFTLYPSSLSIVKFSSHMDFPEEIIKTEGETITFYFKNLPDIEHRVKKPETLAAFIKLWDSLDRHFRLTVLTSKIHLYLILEPGGENPVAAINGKKYSRVKNSPLDTEELTLKNADIYYGINRSPVSGTIKKDLIAMIGDTVVKGNEYKVLIFPDQEHFPIHGQDAFNNFHNENLRKGKFSNAYAETDKITSEFQDLSFGKLIGIVSSQITQAQGKVELVGIKIPYREIIKWGLPIIVVIQLYFLLHLNDLIRVHSEKIQQPWIVLYPGKLTYAASVGTIIFPMFVVLWMVLTKISDLSATGIAIKLMSVFSIIITLSTIKSVNQIRSINR